MRPGRFSQSRMGLRGFRGIIGVGPSGPFVPTASNLIATVLNETSASLTVGVNGSDGNVFAVAINTATGTIPPDADQVIAGQDGSGAAAAWDHNQGVSSSGTQTFAGGITGLTEGQTYRAYAVYRDASLEKSAVVATGDFVPGDVTAPEISSLDLLKSGFNNWTGTVTTDTGEGELDVVITESASAPSVAQVKSGLDHTGAAAADVIADQAVSTSGVQNLSGNSSLSGSTEYWGHAVHTDVAGNETAVLTVAASFTTDVFVPPTAPDQMAAPVVTATGSTSFSIDLAEAPADNGSAIIRYDARYSEDQVSWTVLLDVDDPEPVTDASSDTQYFAQTRAVNGVGPGPWSASGEDTTDAAAGSPVNGVYGITMTGQSLAVGTSGDNGGSGYGASRHNGIMLENSITTGFAAEGGTPRGNTFPTATTATKQFDSGDVALVDALAEIVAAEGGEALGAQSFESLIHNVAVGNSQAAGLIGSQLSYKTYFLPDLAAHQAALTNTGKTLDGKWLGIRRQGERDQVVGTDGDEFRGIVIAEQAMRTSDLSFEFGQDIDYDMVTYQLSSHANNLVAGASGPYIPRIALELLKLCRDETLPIYLSNPTYYLPHADDVHLTGSSYNNLAVDEALAGKRLHWDDARLNFRPMTMFAAWPDGNDIVLRYPVEAGRQLVFDTTLVAAHTNMGFELYESDGVTPITITGVIISGTNEVRLQTGSARAAGEIVRYAYTPPTTGASGVSGPTGGPRGNLRDDTPLTFVNGADTYNLYRWVGHDEFTVSGTSGEPAPWVANPHAVKTLADIATDHSLTGLFDIHTDDATSIVNHAGADGTVTGTPTYSNGGASFGVGDYIDTGIADTTAFTLMAIITPADIPSSVNKNILFNYLSGGVSGGQRTGLYYNRFNDRISTWMRDSGNGLNVSSAEPSFTELNNLRPYMVIATYDPAVDTNYTINLPRYWNPQSDAISAGRTVDGTNFIIGNGSDPILIHAISIAPYKMSFEQQGRLYRDMVYNQRSRGEYI